jgi:hypothetical protein
MNISKCSNGFSSDKLLLYQIPYGPLSTPPGQDCYFNKYIFIGISITATMALLIHLTNTVSKTNIVVDKKKRFIYVIHGLSIIHTFTILTCIFIANFKPDWFRFAHAIFYIITVSFVFTYFGYIIYAYKYLKQYGSGKFSLHGRFGLLKDYKTFFITSLACVSANIFLIMDIMAAATYNKDFEELSLKYYQIALAFGLLAFLLYIATSRMLLNNFICFLEKKTDHNAKSNISVYVHDETNRLNKISKLKKTYNENVISRLKKAKSTSFIAVVVCVPILPFIFFLPQMSYFILLDMILWSIIIYYYTNTVIVKKTIN